MNEELDKFIEETRRILLEKPIEDVGIFCGELLNRIIDGLNSDLEVANKRIEIFDKSFQSIRKK